MAKDNLFLGTARGSVGDVTFSRLNGVQVARVRNRSPRNPQSPAQMVQRIIMSTVGKAYSFFSEICDHSFEGFETGQLSQRKFMELNVALLRNIAADVLAYPIESMVRSSTVYNFSFKNDFAPIVNEFQISAGSLPSLTVIPSSSRIPFILYMDTSELTAQTATYQDICNRLGIQRGDQLTFVQIAHDSSKADHETDLVTGFRFARIIMEPNDGDMSSVFLGTNGVNKPNERNEGSFAVLTLSTDTEAPGLTFRLQEIGAVGSEFAADRQLAGSAVILSRQTGGKWLRSSQNLVVQQNNGQRELNHSTLGLAYETYRIGAASDLYLNQAE